MLFKAPINVTNPNLAPLHEYVKYLEQIWDTGILTHNGPFLQQFEREIVSHYKVKNFTAVSNGTMALQLAIKALDLQGEIITSAFSWVATLSAIQWEKCSPVFCDIDRETLNIDASKIESLITDRTVAIMPVHVFGSPCDVIAIDRLASKYNLKVIYDGAHALGSCVGDKSVLDFGDVSATSLHATKILNTGEGGGCIAQSPDVMDRLQRLRFFGFDQEKQIIEQGCNSKMSELQAALGVANLKYSEKLSADRKQKYHEYLKFLSNVPGLTFQKINPENSNFAYFPIIFETEATLLRIDKVLRENNIFGRRYFYPSLNTLNSIIPASSIPISDWISKRIFCLPLHHGVSSSAIEKICGLIIKEV